MFTWQRSNILYFSPAYMHTLQLMYHLLRSVCVQISASTPSLSSSCALTWTSFIAVCLGTFFLAWLISLGQSIENQMQNGLKIFGGGRLPWQQGVFFGRHLMGMGAFNAWFVFIDLKRTICSSEMAILKSFPFQIDFKMHLKTLTHWSDSRTILIS